MSVTELDELVRVPARENAETRGRRYLVEGRLTVYNINQHRRIISARCKGHGETYQLGHTASGWYCNCPAKTKCAHLVALQLVVEAPDW